MTTIKDTDNTGDATLALKENGELTAPRLLAAGPPLTAHGGYPAVSRQSAKEVYGSA